LRNEIFLCDCLKNPEITSERLSIIRVEVAKGMIKFYSLEYLHRDFKSQNILLDDDFLHHICDF
jgi:serine/threonine protein kinase